jgi:hypothetical protein
MGSGPLFAAFFVPNKIDTHQGLAAGPWLSFGHVYNTSCPGQPITDWRLFAPDPAHFVGPTHALVGLGFQRHGTRTFAEPLARRGVGHHCQRFWWWHLFLRPVCTP